MRATIHAMTTLAFPSLAHPIVQAPMAGGPSTPELAAAVSNAGGLGFLASGYKPVTKVRAEIEALRALTERPFGYNVFLPSAAPADREVVARYAARIAPEAASHGVALGEARFDDDGWREKLELAIELAVPIVSFAFGCPAREVVERLHARGIAVWVTVTEVSEARVASDAGADALVVQGTEAGGHRGSFEDRDGVGEMGLLALLRLCAREVSVPLVAAGGIADGEGVAAVLAAGARAAQIGTAFMRCPEAATNPGHRAAFAAEARRRAAGATRLTRAFSGRRARGIANRFLREHSADAPQGYPELVYLTQPLRAAGDPEVSNLWAGQAFALAEETPAAELVTRWSAEARTALSRALSGLSAT